MNLFRTETDSMGEVQVPVTARYGAQTQRALNNFTISGLCLPPAFIHAVVLIKKTAAQVNGELGLLDKTFAQAIVETSEKILAGEYADRSARSSF